MTENNMTAKDYLNLDLEKADKKDYDGAIKDLTKAIDINPEYALAYYNRGLAKNKKQDYDGAIADFINAIKFDCTNNIDFRIAYSNTLHEIEKFDDTIEELQKALQITEDNNKKIRIYINLGNVQNDKWVYDEKKDKNAKYCKDAMESYKKVFSFTNHTVSSEQRFYRFRPLNQYTLEAFILNKLFVANPETFNDPFDALLLRQEQEEKKPPKTLEEFNKNIRIASLASMNNKEKCPLENILLWSYYAQDHKGIAIGYKLNPKKFKQDKAFLKNVHYSKKLIKINWSNLLEEAYLTKFENWQHEQEWRFVYLKEDDEKDPILLDMTDWGIEIAEIIFGLNCPNHQQDMIYHLFKQKNPNAMPNFYQMERTNDDVFELKKGDWERKDL